MQQDPIGLRTSLLFDGEGDPPSEAEQRHPITEGQLRHLGRLKELFSVPEDVAKPDPGFVVRFRHRRDSSVGAGVEFDAWRLVALRLAPLAATVLLAVGLILWAWSGQEDTFGELETRALGDAVRDVTVETTIDEPVLRIALAEL